VARKIRKRPDLPLIMSVSEKVLGAGNKFLIPVAIFISHKNSALKLREIGQFFSLSISGVSSACQRVRAAMCCNTTLANVIEEIEREVEARKDQAA
jgi:hypothetical protein